MKNLKYPHLYMWWCQKCKTVHYRFNEVILVIFKEAVPIPKNDRQKYFVCVK